MAQQYKNADGDRIITARYAGRCATCPNPILVGQTIAHGRRGARCMACVEGLDFMPPRRTPQRYGPMDANGRPIEPKTQAPPAPAGRPLPPRRTYEDLFGADD